MPEFWPFFLAYATSALLSCHPVRSNHSPVPKFDNVTDRSALLSLKSTISGDPTSPLTSWNDSVHFCHWPGVTCGGRRHPQRVISLELASLDLDGSVSPAIANLTFLRKVDLSGNRIRGPIPHAVGRLYRLRHLDLSRNSLEQGIPASLSWCSKLQVACLNDNLLGGEIPPSLTNLSHLSTLSLGSNRLSGSIPFLLGKMSQLTKLDLSNNYLAGGMPISMRNLSRLSVLNLGSNLLSGSLPPDLGRDLPLLERIYLYGNRFRGSIPLSLPNASLLEIVDASSNMFVGAIPADLGSLKSLRWLNLMDNRLQFTEPRGWSCFLTALGNCTNLEKLELDFNKLGGMLPNSIGNFSRKLQVLTMSGNGISGSVSPGIGDLVGLTAFDMGRNLLEGPIPSSIGALRNLHELHLGDNKLSGEVPSSLGNLTQLISLRLESNELSGVVPTSLGRCQSLILLDLSSNNLTGGIPKEILTIPTLSIRLNLSRNSLTGLIPTEVGTLINLGQIDLSMNKLSGELPIKLSNCRVLEKLYLAGNSFHGNIISALSTLRGMQELDLSQNSFSGKIPDFLQNFTFLRYINLSLNNFEGEVPSSGAFTNITAMSIFGNNKLCGGKPILHLPPCAFRSGRKKYVIAALAAVISFISTLLCLFLVSYFTLKKRRKLESMGIMPRYERGRITYAELARATNGFSTDNLIGMGSYGAVYKGITDSHSKLGVSRFAVKVLNLQQRGASRSFVTERDVLKSMIHRNILRMLTTCSSIDSMGNDFKALIFEFMANGSLDSWLHPIAREQYEPNKLNLIARINIAIDVASALDYLHHNGLNPIIHCDLKPSNILLNDDMTAYVSDFGLAKIGPVETLVRSSIRTATTIALRGTIGYVAPEYGTANRVSTKGDVYSYGILLLEMFTGKRPSDDTFRRDIGIKRYVEMAISERFLNVIDPHLLSTEVHRGRFDAGALDCISSFLRIGVLCSSELPANRPEMRNVVKRLQVLRDVYLANRPFWDPWEGTSRVMQSRWETFDSDSGSTGE